MASFGVNFLLFSSAPLGTTLIFQSPLFLHHKIFRHPPFSHQSPPTSFCECSLKSTKTNTEQQSLVLLFTLFLHRPQVRFFLEIEAKLGYQAIQK